MKLTKNILKQIIIEELKSFNENKRSIREGSDWIQLSSIKKCIDSYGGFLFDCNDMFSPEIMPNTRDWKKLYQKASASDKKTMDSVVNENTQPKKNSISENIKVGSKVIVNYPTLTKPVTGVVGQILQSSVGPVYVLKGGKGVWDASYVSLTEAKKK
jgi:hypothetical protein